MKTPMARHATRHLISSGALRETPINDRMYQRLARTIFEQIASGVFAMGERLPAERELATIYNVSRPVIREALIALEVQGFIEVRVGSGAYVSRIPGQDEEPAFAITAFELTEARLLFEGEAAALAAVHITEEQISRLDALVDAIAAENLQPEVTEEADRDFHLTIAAATRNAGVLRTIEDLWHLRSTSPECALLHAKARHAKVRPVIAEHAAIVDALRARDVSRARTAMRAHLTAVMDHLLFTTEELAIEEARRSVASARRRYGGALPV
ncbi:FadR/GntR family transcriptional regulator [Sphingomonas sp. M6A6_1c]